LKELGLRRLKELRSHIFLAEGVVEFRIPESQFDLPCTLCWKGLELNEKNMS
jgi:hypothetical protein